MVLPSINLAALAQAKQSQVDSNLVLYLCQTMSPLLPRIPTDPDAVSEFVKRAGRNADRAGYGEGRMYSFYIISSMLLGYEWLDDSLCDSVSMALHERSMDLEVRLNLALNFAIAERRRHETVLPEMHVVTRQFLGLSVDGVCWEDMWKAFMQALALRGIGDTNVVFRCFEEREADFRKLHQLPPIKRVGISANEVYSRQHMVLAAPMPDEGITSLKPLGIFLLGRHLLLALSFGRHFYESPLLATLHKQIQHAEQIPRPGQKLSDFLEWHVHVLKEDDHG